MKLVIVESPAKCSKIQSFLGDGWRVMASMGHIRSLQQKLEAVGIDTNWTPLYEELATKKEAISKLKKAAKEASEVWLATDDDREGEGIAFHICHILKLSTATTPRIVFHEITRDAIRAAVATPGRLAMDRVNAQQARAMLDMLVGFTLSRVLWKRVAPRLSAGRCQTPALRLVVERDQEITNYVPRNFWTLQGTVGHGDLPSLTMKAEGEWKEEAVREALQKALVGGKKTVFQSVKERLSTSNAPPPLITSTLQQEASALHGLGPKQTMQAAQKLYEAGHITYMRTDNAQLSEEAAGLLRTQIQDTWGTEYVGPQGQHCMGKAKKDDGVQGAHEAIRPTHPETKELDVDRPQQIVYRLIWRRAMQSQMAAAKSSVRSANLDVSALPSITWTTEQSYPLFEGWKVVDQTEATVHANAVAKTEWDAWTPHFTAATVSAWRSMVAEEVFTKPPGRYTEATLIRELEKRGIGRPSTFASLITVLFDREYVEKTNSEGKVYETRTLALETKIKETKRTHKAGAEKNKVQATSLGTSVSHCLTDGFSDIFAYQFTAQMESGLDEIAHGSRAWKSILQTTWDSYKDRYVAAIAEKDARVAGTAVEGVKVVQTKKGPLLVRPKADGTGGEFAAVPKGELTEDKIAKAFTEAVEVREGELLGMWESEEIRKKKGPYGWYVEAGGCKVPWKPDDTVESLCEKLTAKKGAFERTVGPWILKQGPFGLYFYKPVKGKPKFIGLPNDVDAATVTEEKLKEISDVPKTSNAKRGKN